MRTPVRTERGRNVAIEDCKPKFFLDEFGGSGISNHSCPARVWSISRNPNARVALVISWWFGEIRGASLSSAFGTPDRLRGWGHRLRAGLETWGSGLCGGLEVPDFQCWRSRSGNALVVHSVSQVLFFHVYAYLCACCWWCLTMFNQYCWFCWWCWCIRATLNREAALWGAILEIDGFILTPFFGTVTERGSARISIWSSADRGCWSEPCGCPPQRTGGEGFSTRGGLTVPVRQTVWEHGDDSVDQRLHGTDIYLITRSHKEVVFSP